MKLQGTPLVASALLAAACVHRPPRPLDDARFDPAATPIPVMSSIWLVRADGRARRMDFPFRLGNPDPVPSPDRRRIAFLRSGNVWFLDLETRDCVRLTPFADMPNDTGERTGLTLEGWTPDSRSLVVTASVADEEDGPVRETSLDRCKAVRARADSAAPLNPERFGTYILDAATGAMDRLDKPTVYVGARPVGSVRTAPTVSPPKPSNGDPDQVFVSPSMDRAVLIQTEATERSQVVSVDLKTGESHPVSSRGSYEEYRRPSISPGGAHIAYLDGGTSLVVDGGPIFKAEGISRYWWVDGDVIAAITSRAHEPGLDLRVIRVHDKALLGTYHEEPESR